MWSCQSSTPDATAQTDAAGAGGPVYGHVCDDNCMSPKALPSGCYCDDQCAQFGDCCDAVGSAPSKQDLRPFCSGSTCAACGGEAATKACGNGICNTGETPESCGVDCPVVTKTCVTYAEVQKIFVERCDGCHGHKFGTSCAYGSPFASIAASVANGSMPEGDVLSAADKAKIAAWAEAKNACVPAMCP